MKNPYIPKKYEIIDIQHQTKIDYTYRLAYDITPQNGQFVEVSIPKIGEAPISISDFGPGYIDMTIRRVGKVTDYLHNLRVGDSMFLRGPYGNGFSLDQYKGKHLIITAGGTGLAPVKSIINHFHRNPQEIEKLDLLIGFKSSKDILFAEEIEAWKKNEKFNVILTIDREEEGWSGNVGLVTQYVPALHIPDTDNLEIIIVGPPMMMKFTGLEYLKRNIREDQIWVSFERKMSCGIGKCGHCKIDEIYVCLEGPVFNYAKAKQLMD
ncbi:anaerobic sulfite reductase subunit B [Geosporobacter subterraneus DSM 17957]|uniref:Anaerobic sulfite reductase subunit B n=1 Tax=Geosporobacter subterraneus DSM 17957 TaxID=1121919 RepID=A0A1M6DM27_9FIRM|nr:anaerobic sulfite reductase subunit AsrB [Geosporobacter subterraneus]SHI74367.1 anaerobic sulfite reductase subunit B [Geosporobacter subterraneus DSM 17957]